jgi:FkbM family methyltransferase
MDLKPETARPADSMPKTGLRWMVNLLLRCRGTILPSYFPLQGRISYLLHGLEPSVVRLAAGLLRKGEVALDIGANVGFLTREFAALVGEEGRVFAFEPDPATFECLAFNTRQLPQVRLSNVAISDKNEETTFYLHPTSGMSNSLVNAWENARPLQVQTSTLDAWIEATQPGEIRLIKIDVEGAEAHVLRGMQETLRTATDLSLIMEFCPKNLGSPAVEEEIFALLHGHGYRLQIIRPEGGLRPVEEPRQVDLELNENDYVNLLCQRRPG